MSGFQNKATGFRVFYAAICLTLFAIMFSMTTCAERVDGSLFLNQQVVTYGQDFSLRYYNATGGAWVGFYQTDETGQPLLISSQQAEEFHSGEGSLTVNTLSASLIPGSYEVVFYSSGSIVAGKQQLEVVSNTFYLDRVQYFEGEDGYCFFDSAAVGEGSWIGIYLLEDTPLEDPSLVWGYLPEGGSKIYTGDLNGSSNRFSSLPQGQYKACLFEEEDGQPVQEFVFSIQAPQGVYATYTRAPGAIENTAEGTVTLIGDSDVLSEYYWLYWGDENGVFEDYLPIGTIAKEEATTFDLRANQEAPAGTTRLYLYEGTQKGKAVRTAPLSILLPESITARQDALVTSFMVMSDIHISDSSYYIYNRRAKQAFQDILENMPGISCIVNLGDVVNNGKATEYKELHDMIKDYEDLLPRTYYIMGNHDYSLNAVSAARQQQNFLDSTGMNALYYSFINQGYTFIALSSEGKQPNVYLDAEEAWISGTQLRWLEKELAAAQERNPDLPIFVFMHQPLKDTGPGTQRSTIVQNDELQEILDQYPQVVYFSGHTHYTMNEDDVVLSGNGEGISTVHAGSVSSLWEEDGGEYVGSEGCLVEVYTGYIRIRGRDFEKESWMGSAQYIIYTK